MTKFKGLLTRKCIQELSSSHVNATSQVASQLTNAMFANYTSESNLSRQLRPVTTVNGNMNTTRNQANSDQSEIQQSFQPAISSELINKKRMVSRTTIPSALIMDLSTNLEQSHVKQRLARFYEQSASESNVHHHHHHQHREERDEETQHHSLMTNHMRMSHEANQTSLADSSAGGSSSNTSDNQSNNTHSNSNSNSNSNNGRFATVLTSIGRTSAPESEPLMSSTWSSELKNHPVHHLHNHTVSTIINSPSNRATSASHLHHSINSQVQCSSSSLSSPPPPAESPVLSGASFSASNSSVSSPYSRQMDIEGTVNGYTNLMSSGSSGKKRKRRPQPIPDNCKDDAYWERRKRNNESAKRSRELRRRKEQQTTMRVIYLEQDNLKLKTEVDMLRTEVEKLQEMLFARNGNSFH